MTDAVHTPVSGVPPASRAGRRTEPHLGGRTEWIATHFQALPSLLVSWIVSNAGAVVVAGVMIVLGLFTTKVLLSVGTITRADDWLPIWFANHRTAVWTSAARIGSVLGDVPVLFPVVGGVATALILTKRWRMASFVIQAGLAEGLAYLLTVAVVVRHRPDVVHLGNYNPNHSFPSGHTAAAVAVYGAIALLLTAHIRRRWGRVAIWSVAAAIPVIVGVSRIYGGEHHPIDVAAGALMGIGALLAALTAVRTARMVAELHAARRAAKART
jgi:membrane-associated phospholipid phosphatase